jgi:ATP-dependent helicase YprA (DUF1998 family)
MTTMLMLQFEIDQWVAANQVTIDGRDVPRPVFEFNEAGFPRTFSFLHCHSSISSSFSHWMIDVIRIAAVISDLLYGNYQHPTVIQSATWPIAMSGRDVISIAKTGSGKTLAVRFLPSLLHLPPLPVHPPGHSAHDETTPSGTS